MISKQEILDKNEIDIKKYLIYYISEFFEKREVEKELNELLPNVPLFRKNNIYNKSEIEKKLFLLNLEEIYDKIFNNKNNLKLLKDHLASFYFLPDEIIKKLLKDNSYEYPLSMNLSLSSSFIEIIAMQSYDKLTLSNLFNLPNIHENVIRGLKNMAKNRINIGYAQSIYIDKDEIDQLLVLSTSSHLLKKTLIRNKNISYETLNNFNQLLKNNIKKINNLIENLKNEPIKNKDDIEYEEKKLQESLIEKNFIEKELEYFKLQLNGIEGKEEPFNITLHSENFKIIPFSRLLDLIEISDSKNKKLITKYEKFLDKIKRYNEDTISEDKNSLTFIPKYMQQLTAINKTLNDIQIYKTYHNIENKKIKEISDVTINDDFMYI